MPRGKVIKVRFPEDTDDREIARRLRRLNLPEESAEQERKSAVQVGLESRELARTGRRVEDLESRTEIVERAVADVAPTLAELRELRGFLESGLAELRDANERQESTDAELAALRSGLVDIDNALDAHREETKRKVATVKGQLTKLRGSREGNTE